MSDRTHDSFTAGYIECALWSSGTYVDCHGKACDDDGEQAEYQHFDGMDAELSTDALDAMERDCRKFQDDNASLLAAAVTATGNDYSRAGHDFWLTRNGHGAGFWDGDWDAAMADYGDALTAAAKLFPECDLYLGDDGRICAS